jgi:hypothetical protein
MSACNARDVNFALKISIYQMRQRTTLDIEQEILEVAHCLVDLKNIYLNFQWDLKMVYLFIEVYSSPLLATKIVICWVHGLSLSLPLGCQTKLIPILRLD